MLIVFLIKFLKFLIFKLYYFMSTQRSQTKTRRQVNNKKNWLDQFVSAIWNKDVEDYNYPY